MENTLSFLYVVKQLQRTHIKSKMNYNFATHNEYLISLKG